MHLESADSVHSVANLPTPHARGLLQGLHVEMPPTFVGTVL